jgi:transcriptional regulator with XRE-family HTH domain
MRQLHDIGTKSVSQKPKMQPGERPPLVTSVGQRIRDRRKDLGLSQNELGERVGLSRVAISHIENGQRKQLKPELIRRIALALDSPEAVFYGIPLGENNMSPALKRILPGVFSLPRSEQDNLAGIIEQLLDWRASGVVSNG